MIAFNRPCMMTSLPLKSLPLFSLSFEGKQPNLTDNNGTPKHRNPDFHTLHLPLLSTLPRCSHFPKFTQHKSTPDTKLSTTSTEDPPAATPVSTIRGATIPQCPQPGPGPRGWIPFRLGWNLGLIRSHVGQQAHLGLPYDPLLRALRREHLLGGQRPLDPPGCRQIMGEGTQVLQSEEQCLPSRETLRPLYTDCMEGYDQSRMCPSQMFKRWYLYDLLLRSSWKLRQWKPISAE